MAVFAYKALDRAAAVRGTVVADTPRAARDVLPLAGFDDSSRRTDARPAACGFAKKQ